MIVNDLHPYVPVYVQVSSKHQVLTREMVSINFYGLVKGFNIRGREDSKI